MIVVCGPTASGKTDLAIRWAQEREGEILNADMGQLYRGMDIGTAKPTPAERSDTPIHLIDLVDPPERFGAGAYRKRALEIIEAVRRRGRIPIIVGGTGLYLKGLVDGLFEGPPSDPKIREGLARRIDAEGLSSLYTELQGRDPTAALKIHPNDRLRIVRALEVLTLTGRPISSLQQQWRPSVPTTPAIEKVAIEWTREELYRRIDTRVERMFDQGWIEEVRPLIERWGEGAYALQNCIGYREIAAYLAGRMSQEELVPHIQRRTRQYAKRQMTWFKADPSIRWLPSSIVH